MDVTIEPARVAEAEAILKLQYLCYQREAALYNDYTMPPLTQTLASLLQEYDTHRILAARIGSEVVGSVRATEKNGTCLIGRLIVHPRIQKRGIGTRLVDAIEREFPRASRYELFTGDRSESNLRLYQRLGYTPFRKQAMTPLIELIFLEKVRLATI